MAKLSDFRITKKEVDALTVDRDAFYFDASRLRHPHQAKRIAADIRAGLFGRAIVEGGHSAATVTGRYIHHLDTALVAAMDGRESGAQIVPLRTGN